jgi:hypothetical protein
MENINILSRGVARVFRLTNRNPPADYAWRLGNAEGHIVEALSSMLSYTDAIRVAVALNAYAIKI